MQVGERNKSIISCGAFRKRNAGAYALGRATPCPIKGPDQRNKMTELLLRSAARTIRIKYSGAQRVRRSAGHQAGPGAWKKPRLVKDQAGLIPSMDALASGPPRGADRAPDHQHTTDRARITANPGTP